MYKLIRQRFSPSARQAKHQNRDKSAIGWSHFFQHQMSFEEWEATFPARVAAVHGKLIDIISEQDQQQIAIGNARRRQEYLAGKDGSLNLT